MIAFAAFFNRKHPESPSSASGTPPKAVYPHPHALGDAMTDTTGAAPGAVTGPANVLRLEGSGCFWA
jgi:hypothetical protein